MQEEQRQDEPQEQRKLKIRGGGVVEAKGEGKKEGKEKIKESGSKMWVMIILGVSVVVSVIFSLKNRKPKSNFESERQPTRNEKSVQESGGLFGPAVYEFER